MTRSARGDWVDPVPARAEGADRPDGAMVARAWWRGPGAALDRPRMARGPGR